MEKRSSHDFLLLNNTAHPDTLVKTALAHSIKQRVTLESLKKMSSVTLASGEKIYKFARYYQEKPVLGDWAMATLTKSGRINTVQYHLSEPEIPASQKVTPQAVSWALPHRVVINNVQQKLGLRVLANSVKSVWFKHKQSLVPAYSLNAGEVLNGQPSLYTLVINAQTGEVLFKTQTSQHVKDFKYRIYAQGSPLQPFQNPYGFTSPSLSGVPSESRPDTFVAQQDFTISELSNTVDDPWLADNATETIGNNVDVFFNFTRGTDGTFDFFGDGYGPQFRNRDDEFDQDFRAPITGQDELFYTYDPINYLDDYFQPTDSNRNPEADEIELINAQQVQAFYLANLLHDLFYDAGFTETAGNAQASNFGRGGLEGDPLIIHINSFTFISTPGDGESPVIHLGRSRGGSTAFDTSVFAHEWTHYMHRRLVNPMIEIRNNQSRALNEGWADVVGVLMSMKPSDFSNTQSVGFQSTYAFGSYFTQDLISDDFLDPFFFGIRRFPYGPSNPFTFEHIAHKAPLPDQFEFSNYIGRGTQNSQIHTAGEIWADTVLACFKDVISNNSSSNFNDVRQQLANIVVSAMSATPPDPTFLEARNALLEASKANSLVSYQQCRIRFAEKGMGSGALSPPRESKDFAERVVSFENNSQSLSIVTAQLRESAGSFDNDGILDSGERGELVLQLRNTGFETIRRASLKLVADNTSYQILSASPIVINDIAIGADVTVTLPIKLTHKRHFDLTNMVVDADIEPSGTSASDKRQQQLSQAFRTHYDQVDVATGENTGDDFSLALDAWQLDRIQEQSFIDSSWQPANLDTDEVLQIDEPFLGSERNMTQRAFVSPWLQRDSNDLRFEFSHAFRLPNDAFVEITTDDISWEPFDTSASAFSGDSSAFPNLLPVTLSNNTIAENEHFKLRLRVNTFSPFTWRLDNFKLSGAQASAFSKVITEDNRGNSEFCFPIKSKQGVAVVCL